MAPLMGDDPHNPSAVFFGRSAFKGLLVARSDVGSAPSHSSILPNEVLARNKRAALVCRPFPLMNSGAIGPIIRAGVCLRPGDGR